MHTTVLKEETVDGLDIHKGDVVFDGTVGGGGHSEVVCQRFGRQVYLLMADRDEEAIKMAERRLEPHGCRKSFFVGRADEISTMLTKIGVGKIQRAMLDLGMSSIQLETSGRGFSFLRDEPLLMNFDMPARAEGSAGDIVNRANAAELEDIFFRYGEEKFGRRIANRIVEARKKKFIASTKELAEIVAAAVPRKFSRIHPATKVFQALRIAVNDELGALERAIQNIFSYLAPGGRLAIISFHSLEDRIVKLSFREMKEKGEGTLITKKPIVPTEEEIKKNPRARSAKLRIIEKC